MTDQNKPDQNKPDQNKPDEAADHGAADHARPTGKRVVKFLLVVVALVFTLIGLFSAAQLPSSIVAEGEAEQGLMLVTGIGLFIGSVGVLIFIGLYQNRAPRQR